MYKNNGKETPHRYDFTLFVDLIPAYMKNVYPVWPAISEEEVRESIALMDDSKHRAFVYTIAAVTLAHTQLKAEKDIKQQVEDLLLMALHARGPIMANEEFCVRRIMTSIGLSSLLVWTGDVEVAWLYLREAITMASIVELVKCDSSPQEKARRLRVYWILYIHERFMAIHYYRSVILTPILLPEEDIGLPAGVHNGFLQIVKLFSLVDSNFINAYRGEDVTESWFQEKQSEINKSEFNDLNEMQQADLIITQQWLLMLVWQMAVSRYSSEGCMSLLFPAEIAKKLRQINFKMFDGIDRGTWSGNL